LSTENFDLISRRIITWANKSERETDGRTLILVIKLIFEKATDEDALSELYAYLCHRMVEQISPNVHNEGSKNAEGLPITGGQLFRKYLLNRCQEDFERGWAVHRSAAGGQAKRQGFGLVKFMGELFKLQMLPERSMHECIRRILDNVKNPEEEEIELLCELLSTVGQALDTSKARTLMDIYFDRMQQLSTRSNVTSRMQFMLLVRFRSANSSSLVD